MIKDGRSKSGGLSLLEANCAAACLDFKGRLGTGSMFAGIYERTADRIQAKMGPDPDIDGDQDTRIHLNPFDRRVTLRAADFVLHNSGAVIEDQVRTYTIGPTPISLLLPLEPEERQQAIDHVRQEYVMPAVGRFIVDTVQMQLHL